MPICPQCGALGEELGSQCKRDQCRRNNARLVRETAFGLSHQDSNIGRVLDDRFVLVDYIGGGAMGDVYEGIQERLGRRCAVKLLKSDLVCDKNTRRFQREAELVARLNHPNMVTLYNYGVARDGTSYMAMEFVEGQPLSSFQPYGFAEIDVVYIIAQLLDALTSAHQRQILHRDLKPENIMVCNASRLHKGELPRIKVLDFGLAKLMEGREQTVLTMTGEVFGTPRYMPPEQALNSLNSLLASDVYSLGVILYELFAGRTPFEAPTALGVMLQHVNSAVPTPSARAGLSISPELEGLLMRCLAKDPLERFEHAGALLLAFLETPEWLRSKGPLEDRKQSLLNQRAIERSEDAHDLQADLQSNVFSVVDDDDTRSLTYVLKAKSSARLTAAEAEDSNHLQPPTVDGQGVFQSRDLHFENVCGVLAPFGGREQELERLQQTLHAMLDTQQGHVIHLTGAAGIGKSRILAAFEQYISLSEDLYVLHDFGRFAAQPNAPAAEVFVQMLRRRLNVQSTDRSAALVQKLRHLFRQWISQDPSRLSEQEVQLLGFLHYLIENGDKPDPAQILRHNAVLKWLVLYYSRLLANHPVVMVIDDFHWATPAAQRLVFGLWSALADRPILLVLAGRHAPSQTSAPTSYTVHIDVPPLPEHASDLLIRRLLHRLPNPPHALITQINAQTRGAPDAIEQTIRELAVAGVLQTPPHGPWRLQLPTLHDEPPPNPYSDDPLDADFPEIEIDTNGLDSDEHDIHHSNQTYPHADNGLDDSNGGDDDADDADDADDDASATMTESLSALHNQTALSAQDPPFSDERTDHMNAQDIKSMIEAEYERRATQTHRKPRG